MPTSQNLPGSSASYIYPGQFGGAPPPGSGVAAAGRGPVDVYIIGSNISGGTASTVSFGGVPQPVFITSGSSGGGGSTTISGTVVITGTVNFGGVAQPITGNVGFNSPQPVFLSGTSFAPVTTILTSSTTEVSSTFTGNSYSVVFGPTDVSLFSNVALTIINNAATAILSASIEWSPNNSQFEVWDTISFANLQPATVKSMQISGNSRKFLRVRMIPSGSGGQLTGSTDIFVNANNG